MAEELGAYLRSLLMQNKQGGGARNEIPPVPTHTVFDPQVVKPGEGSLLDLNEPDYFKRAPDIDFLWLLTTDPEFDQIKLQRPDLMSYQQRMGEERFKSPKPPTSSIVLPNELRGPIHRGCSYHVFHERRTLEQRLTLALRLVVDISVQGESASDEQLRTQMVQSVANCSILRFSVLNQDLDDLKSEVVRVIHPRRGGDNRIRGYTILFYIRFLASELNDLILLHGRKPHGEQVLKIEFRYGQYSHGIRMANASCFTEKCFFSKRVGSVKIVDPEYHYALIQSASSLEQVRYGELAMQTLIERDMKSGTREFRVREKLGVEGLPGSTDKDFISNTVGPSLTLKIASNRPEEVLLLLFNLFDLQAENRRLAEEKYDEEVIPKPSIKCVNSDEATAAIGNGLISIAVEIWQTKQGSRYSRLVIRFDRAKLRPEYDDTEFDFEVSFGIPLLDSFTTYRVPLTAPLAMGGFHILITGKAHKEQTSLSKQVSFAPEMMTDKKPREEATTTTAKEEIKSATKEEVPAVVTPTIAPTTVATPVVAAVKEKETKSQLAAAAATVEQIGETKTTTTTKIAEPTKAEPEKNAKAALVVNSEMAAINALLTSSAPVQQPASQPVSEVASKAKEAPAASTIADKPSTAPVTNNNNNALLLPGFPAIDLIAGMSVPITEKK
jgi:hypothetical protein